MTRVALVDDVELDLGVPVVHEPASPLALTNAEVARLTKPQREARVRDLITDAWRIYARALTETAADGKQVAAVVALFSGGNDSTVAAHLFRGVLTHAGHAHTTVGIEATRQYVRDTCAAWGLPLLERRPPRLADQYRAMVLDTSVDAESGRPRGGFPGPRLHWKMYQRLKLRGIEAMQRELLDGRHRSHRVLFIAGRRRDESRNRADVPETERTGARVWVSPMVHWTKLDLNTYRLMHAGTDHPVPVNAVAELIHMSGECLCGSYANVGERDQLDAFYPADMALIRDLEAELLLPAYDHIPAHRKVWGWAGIPELAAASRVYDATELQAKAEGLCQSCAPPDLALPGL